MAEEKDAAFGFARGHEDEENKDGHETEDTINTTEGKLPKIILKDIDGGLGSSSDDDFDPPMLPPRLLRQVAVDTNDHIAYWRNDLTLIDITIWKAGMASFMQYDFYPMMDNLTDGLGTKLDMKREMKDFTTRIVFKAMFPSFNTTNGELTVFMYPGMLLDTICRVEELAFWCRMMKSGLNNGGDNGKPSKPFWYEPGIPTTHTDMGAFTVMKYLDQTDDALHMNPVTIYFYPTISPEYKGVCMWTATVDVNKIPLMNFKK